jgi:hypothetical protein
MMPPGYKRGEDGLWRKPVQFVSRTRGQENREGAEVLVRSDSGRLVRVERGTSARRFFLCAP